MCVPQTEDPTAESVILLCRELRTGSRDPRRIWSLHTGTKTSRVRQGRPLCRPCSEGGCPCCPSSCPTVPPAQDMRLPPPQPCCICSRSGPRLTLACRALCGTHLSAQWCFLSESHESHPASPGYCGRPAPPREGICSQLAQGPSG